MKLKNNRSGIFNLDVSEVHEIDNVRKVYKNIESLAESILKYGQEQACGVDKDNNIVWGHRRLRAVKLLVDRGESIQLKCVQAQGDRKCMQMIENLHRDDLTAEEKENGIADMVEKLGSQKVVSVALCLPPQKISDIMNAHETRLKAFDAGEDTKDMSTSTVNTFRSVPEEKLSEVIKKTKKNGGTVKAAKEAVKDLYDGEKDFPEVKKRTSKKSLQVGCFRENCKYVKNAFCSCDSITIDSFGMCSNFEEV